MSEEKNISPENYANWFTLLALCKHIGSQKAIHISSGELGKFMDVSQQTASRRLLGLEELEWIERKIEGKSQTIRITKEGSDMLLIIYKDLKAILENILIVGKVIEGMGEGGYYVAIKGYYDQFKEKLGFLPFKGTLNLELNELNKSLFRENLETRSPIIINGFKDINSERSYGDVECFDCYIAKLDDRENKINAAFLKIERTHHKKNVIELLAEPYLRDYFNLKDGDYIIIEFNKK